MKVTISLDKEIHTKAKEYSKREGRTFSGMLSLLLKKYLEEQENGDKK